MQATDWTECDEKGWLMSAASSQKSNLPYKKTKTWKQRPCVFIFSGVDVDTKRHRRFCAWWQPKESEGARGSVGLSGLGADRRFQQILRHSREKRRKPKKEAIIQILIFDVKGLSGSFDLTTVIQWSYSVGRVDSSSAKAASLKSATTVNNLIGSLVKVFCPIHSL